MTANERYNIYISNEYDEKVMVAVIDWAATGTESIEDEILRRQTERAVAEILDQPSVIAGRVKTLVLGDDAIKVAAELTDALVKQAVDRAFSGSIGYIVR